MTFAHLDSAILAALKAGERLTPAIAADRWRCMALHSAIARLRDNGHDIKCVMRSANGRRYGEYSITGESACRQDSDGAYRREEWKGSGYPALPPRIERAAETMPQQSMVKIQTRPHSQVAHSYTASQSSVANFRTAPNLQAAPSQEGVGQREVASAVPPHKNCVLVETEGVGADGRRFTMSYTACMVDE